MEADRLFFPRSYIPAVQSYMVQNTGHLYHNIPSLLLVKGMMFAYRMMANRFPSYMRAQEILSYILPSFYLQRIAMAVRK